MITKQESEKIISEIKEIILDAKEGFTNDDFFKLAKLTSDYQKCVNRKDNEFFPEPTSNDEYSKQLDYMINYLKEAR